MIANIIIKRLFQLIFVLWSISSLVFFLSRLIPGSPADNILGPDASEIDKLYWLTKYGFTKPIWEQYIDFLKNILNLSFGKSYSNYSDVIDIVIPKLKETAKLGLCAFSFSVILATIFGIISGAKEGKGIDKIISIISLLAISSPSFIVGPILLWIFSVQLDILPLFGSSDFSSYILPTVTLGASLAAFSSRMIRAGIIEVLQEDYIRTAKSKGLSSVQILIKHALRNAFLPTLTILGMQLGVLLSGTIITEQIFNWPGMGSLLIEAVQQREYNIISACVIIIASIYVISNLLVDLLYQFFDPRVRTP